MPLPPPFDGTLVRARALTPGVRELTFERLDGQAMEFSPGQWVNAYMPGAEEADETGAQADADGTPPALAGALSRPDGTSPALAGAWSRPDESSPLKRSYSIASPPDGSPRFELAVTRVSGGPVSTWLHTLEVGAIVRFVGPQGFFTRPLQDAPPSLIVATGTGVTPMRSMMRAAVTAGSRAPMWLLLGVRHEEDLLYRDEFEAMAREHPVVRFEPTLSQPRELGAEWRGRRGYVQAHVPELWSELAALGGKPVSYICGLERMISSVRRMLRVGMGLPREQVRTERYD